MTTRICRSINGQSGSGDPGSTSCPSKVVRRSRRCSAMRWRAPPRAGVTSTILQPTAILTSPSCIGWCPSAPTATCWPSGVTSRRWRTYSDGCWTRSRRSTAKRSSGARPNHAIDCCFSCRRIRCWWSTHSRGGSLSPIPPRIFYCRWSPVDAERVPGAKALIPRALMPCVLCWPE